MPDQEKDDEKKMKKQVSKAVVKRLPRYRRYLEDLKRKGVERISSSELSELIGYTASQIRQDLNTFGGFGQQGYGYNVEALYREISQILGLDSDYKMVIIGVGNLGHAVANYTHIYKEGFEIIGLFDVNPKLIGEHVNDLVIKDLDELQDFLKDNDVEIGIITTNKSSAQSIADKLVEGGVKGIWNFAPVDLSIPDDVALENVHLTDSLHSVAFHIKHKIK